MPDGDRSAQEIHATLAALARALGESQDGLSDDAGDIDVNEIPQLAAELAARAGPAAARRLLLRAAHEFSNWLRHLELGVVADLDAGTRTMVSGNLMFTVEQATNYGLLEGIPTEQLANEVVAAGIHDDAGRNVADHLLPICYNVAGRHDLALSLQARTSSGLPRAQQLLTLLDTSRRAYVSGYKQQVRDLIAMTNWPSDPTGLARSLLGCLVETQEPISTGPSGPLSQALVAVMFSAEDAASRWRSLSVALSTNKVTEQALLADEVAELQTHRESDR